MKTASWIFSILMGAALLATWAVLFLRGAVPELATSPIQTSMLLVAEILTGAVLIAAGIGSLARRSWGPPLNLVAQGMLVYCTINFSGVLGQQGNLPAAFFFVVVALLALAFAARGLRESIQAAASSP